MTEEEAKQRWCPFARAMETKTTREMPAPVIATNRTYNFESHSFGPSSAALCLGSACMAWQWQHESSTHWAGNLEPTFTDSTTIGYCGLATRRFGLVGKSPK